MHSSPPSLCDSRSSMTPIPLPSPGIASDTYCNSATPPTLHTSSRSDRIQLPAHPLPDPPSPHPPSHTLSSLASHPRIFPPYMKSSVDPCIHVYTSAL